MGNFAKYLFSNVLNSNTAAIWVPRSSCVDDDTLVPKIRKQSDGLDTVHSTGLQRKEQT